MSTKDEGTRRFRVRSQERERPGGHQGVRQGGLRVPGNTDTRTAPRGSLGRRRQGGQAAARTLRAGETHGPRRRGQRARCGGTPARRRQGARSSRARGGGGRARSGVGRPEGGGKGEGGKQKTSDHEVSLSREGRLWRSVCPVYHERHGSHLGGHYSLVAVARRKGHAEGPAFSFHMGDTHRCRIHSDPRPIRFRA
jgi:hypothetical protein